MKYITSFFANIGLTNGRTSRNDFLITIVMLVIFNLVLSMVSGFISRILFIPSLFTFAVTAFNVIFFLATITLQIRRLHDTNRSGLNLLLNIIPIVGQIILFIFFVTPGDASENRYEFPEEI